MVAPLTAGAVGGALVVAGPTLLTLLLAEGSNRPAIDYAGAARGAVHPALLLTAVIPNLFGVDGPFVDYWGPPSPRWGESSYVLARNMGVLYAGALPFALLVAGVFKGVLWAREIRPVTIGLALMLLYAARRRDARVPARFRALARRRLLPPPGGRALPRRRARRDRGGLSHAPHLDAGRS